MSPDPAILVVEDNDDDLFFMRRALKAVAPSLAVHYAMDGRAALEYLRGANGAQRPHPAIVFLDLKLPFVHGLDVLAEIRRDPDLQALRVFILTSSSEDKDRTRACELGVQGYFVKPPTAEMLRPILAGLVRETARATP